MAVKIGGKNGSGLSKTGVAVMSLRTFLLLSFIYFYTLVVFSYSLDDLMKSYMKRVVGENVDLLSYFERMKNGKWILDDYRMYYLASKKVRSKSYKDVLAGIKWAKLLIKYYPDSVWADDAAIILFENLGIIYDRFKTAIIQRADWKAVKKNYRKLLSYTLLKRAVKEDDLRFVEKIARLLGRDVLWWKVKWYLAHGKRRYITKVLDRGKSCKEKYYAFVVSKTERRAFEVLKMPCYRYAKKAMQYLVDKVIMGNRRLAEKLWRKRKSFYHKEFQEVANWCYEYAKRFSITFLSKLEPYSSLDTRIAFLKRISTGRLRLEDVTDVFRPFYYVFSGKWRELFSKKLDFEKHRIGSDYLKSLKGWHIAKARYILGFDEQAVDFVVAELYAQLKASTSNQASKKLLQTLVYYLVRANRWREVVSLGIRYGNKLWQYPAAFKKCFINASRRYRVPLILLYGLAKTESNFNCRAFSISGAYGVMQIMPGTARWIKKRLGVRGDWHECCTNINYGAAYLAYLKRQTDWLRAVAAYNGGLRRVKNLKPEELLFSVGIAETEKYVYKVLYNSYQYFKIWGKK